MNVNNFSIDIVSLLEDSNSQYNEQTVFALENSLKNVNKEMSRIKNTIQGDVIPEDVSINYILLTFYRDRCRRILRTYHLNRILNNRILNNRILNNRILNNRILNISEIKILRCIKEIEEEYLGKYNLNYEGTVPLLSYVKIMTQKDCGVVYDGDELLELKKGRIYFIKRKIVEHLLEGEFIKIME